MTSTINNFVSEFDDITKPRTKRTAKKGSRIWRGAHGRYTTRCDDRRRADYKRFEPHERDDEAYYSEWSRASKKRWPGFNFDFVDPHEFDGLDNEVERDLNGDNFQRAYEMRNGIPRNCTTESSGFNRYPRTQTDDAELEEPMEFDDPEYEGEDAYAFIDLTYDVETMSVLLYAGGHDDFENHRPHFED